VSCTVFDDVVVAGVASASAGGTPAGAGGDPDGGGGGAPSGAGGTAGAGGGEPKVGYLSISQAATLCARVFSCEMVAETIRASTGLPIGRTSFSHCVTWLAGPMPTNRPPSSGQVAMLEDMVEAADCEATRKVAWVEKLGDADVRCEGKTGRKCSSLEGGVIDCNRKHIERCGNALLGASSYCVEVAGTAACVAGECGDFSGHCLGDKELKYCLGPGAFWQIAGCGERGLLCHSAPTYDCRDEAGADQSCGTAGFPQCDGKVAKVCTEGIGTAGWPEGNKVKSPFDCAEVGVGATCQLQPALHCEPPAPSCSLSKPDDCVGSHIQLCVGGDEETFDCADIDMECVPASPARCGDRTAP
jgi:hypothetical protein